METLIGKKRQELFGRLTTNYERWNLDSPREYYKIQNEYLLQSQIL